MRNNKESKNLKVNGNNNSRVEKCKSLKKYLLGTKDEINNLMKKDENKKNGEDSFKFDFDKKKNKTNKDHNLMNQLFSAIQNFPQKDLPETQTKNQFPPQSSSNLNQNKPVNAKPQMCQFKEKHHEEMKKDEKFYEEQEKMVKNQDVQIKNLQQTIRKQETDYKKQQEEIKSNIDVIQNQICQASKQPIKLEYRESPQNLALYDTLSRHVTMEWIMQKKQLDRPYKLSYINPNDYEKYDFYMKEDKVHLMSDTVKSLEYLYRCYHRMTEYSRTTESIGDIKGFSNVEFSTVLDECEPHTTSYRYFSTTDKKTYRRLKFEIHMNRLELENMEFVKKQLISEKEKPGKIETELFFESLKKLVQEIIIQRENNKELIIDKCDPSTNYLRSFVRLVGHILRKPCSLIYLCDERKMVLRNIYNDFEKLLDKEKKKLNTFEK